MAEYKDQIVGWASANQYNNRCAYDGVADLSVYISRELRGSGIGKKLLVEIESIARENRFHKMVLSFNHLGQGLYKKWVFLKLVYLKTKGFLMVNLLM